MVTTRNRLPAHRDSEAITPELALVDPVLAASARQQLPDVGDSLSRGLHVTARPSAPDGTLGALPPTVRDVAAGSRSPSREPRSRSWRAVAAVAAATVVILLLLDVRVQVGRTPASAESAAIAEQGEAELSSAVGRPAGLEIPQPRRFAWAPTAGASGYHVELFRGPAMVFSKNTSTPQMTVPARWTHRGQQRSLSPGEYRWYVWPVAAGRRAAQAIVQAKLVVPSG